METPRLRLVRLTKLSDSTVEHPLEKDEPIEGTCHFAPRLMTRFTLIMRYKPKLLSTSGVTELLPGGRFKTHHSQYLLEVKDKDGWKPYVWEQNN